MRVSVLCLAIEPIELTTDVLVTAECRANRRDELVASGIFQDVSERTGRQSCLHQHQLGMHRDEHDAGVRVVAPDQR